MFILDNNTIIQTGQDLDLSGLSTITGVEIITIGRKYIYDLGELSLEIQGELNIGKDSETSELLLIGTMNSYNTDIIISGTLTVGYLSTKAEIQKSTNYEIYIQEKHNHNFDTSKGKFAKISGTVQPFLVCTQTGTFNWYGGISFSGGIGFDGVTNTTSGSSLNSTVNIIGGVWDARTITGLQYLYSYTENLYIDGFDIISHVDSNPSKKGACLVVLASPIKIKNYRCIFGDVAINGSSSSSDVKIIFEDYISNSGGRDFRSISSSAYNGEIVFLNSEKGTDNKIERYRSDYPGFREIHMQQEVIYKIVPETLGVDLVTLVATEDKNKKLYNQKITTSLADFNQNGIILSNLLTLCSYDTNVTLTEFSPELGDKWDIYTYSYGYLPRSRLKSIMRGPGKKEIEFIIQVDNKVKERNIQIANSKNILNLNDLYDATQAYKFTPFGLTYPDLRTNISTADTKAVTINADIIELRTELIQDNIEIFESQEIGTCLIKSPTLEGTDEFSSLFNIVKTGPGTYINNIEILGLESTTKYDLDRIIADYVSLTIPGSYNIIGSKIKKVINRSQNNNLIKLVLGENSTVEELIGNIEIVNPRTLTLTNLVQNSEIRIYDLDLNELSGVENSGTSYDYIYNYQIDQTVIIVIFNKFYSPIRIEVECTNNSTFLPISQKFDRNYQEDS